MRAPPHDLDAEKAVLAAMLTSADDAQLAMTSLAASDLYAVAHARVFEAISDLRESGSSVDVTAVMSWLTAHPEFGVPMDRRTVNGLLAHPTLGLKAHVRVVALCAAKRRAIAEAERLAQAGYDASTTADDLADLAERLPDRIALPGLATAPGPGIDAYLTETDPEPDWVAPGLLERGERLAITGWMEGGGKSTLLRQFAVQAAAGIVPFTSSQRMNPARVLFVDCENPPALVRRRFRSLVISAGSDLDDPMRLVVLNRPEGLNLLGQRDRAWLTGHVEANRPDLVMIGPLYKLHEDDPTAEQPARALAAFLDRLRVRYQFSLMVEAHPPNESQGFKRPLRIYGASLWRRWFDIGIGLTEDDDGYHLPNWRGFRADGEWPKHLQRGGEWPWMPTMAAMMGAGD